VPLDATHFGMSSAATISATCVQMIRVELQGRLLHLRFEIIGQFAAHLGFDREPRLAVGHAEEAVQHLIRCDRIAVARERLRVGAAGDDFAVDQYAVAIEDDEVYGRRGVHLVSSSSGTQYSSRR
jgi:hypothetical protein